MPVLSYELKVVCQAIGPGRSLVAEAEVHLKAQTYESVVAAARQAQKDCVANVRIAEKIYQMS